GTNRRRLSARNRAERPCTYSSPAHPLVRLRAHCDQLLGVLADAHGEQAGLVAGGPDRAGARARPKAPARVVPNVEARRWDHDELPVGLDPEHAAIKASRARPLT